uniref:Putative secreted protein n=1 Tax=Amblyomma triste TaxID=251400 RepID=A0A023GBA2_AMBTT
MQKWQVALVLTLLASHSSFCGPFKLCTGGCYKPNEEKATCVGSNSGENLCPGVFPRICHQGQEICRCNSKSFLRNDLVCVPKRDCVARTNDFNQFITSSSSYRAALISSGVELDFKTKCLTSTLISRSSDRVTVKVNYREMIGRISDFKIITENGRSKAVWTNHREQWLRKDFDVELQKKDHTLSIRNTAKVSRSTRSTWTAFHIIYSNADCLILGKELPGVLTCFTKDQFEPIYKYYKNIEK